jgi:hypothetical protein
VNAFLLGVRAGKAMSILRDSGTESSSNIGSGGDSTRVDGGGGGGDEALQQNNDAIIVDNFETDAVGATSAKADSLARIEIRAADSSLPVTGEDTARFEDGLQNWDQNSYSDDASISDTESEMSGSIGVLNQSELDRNNVLSQVGDALGSHGQWFKTSH